ncbi:hypothetical protein O7A70_06660 [Mesorhizobium sp. Cs1299R1N1]|uniref:hypothetical protein n=1 Tax=Mesorhizobium sp. Cs1299R1N1 TaxID=3015172 RepID=UPI00301D1C41
MDDDDPLSRIVTVVEHDGLSRLVGPSPLPFLANEDLCSWFGLTLTGSALGSTPAFSELSGRTSQAPFYRAMAAKNMTGQTTNEVGWTKDFLANSQKRK